VRIGIDARLLAYRMGGISRYTRHLIQGFAAMATPHQFVVLQSRKQRRPLVQAPRVRTVSLWTPPHHRWEGWALSLELWPRRLHLLHSPDFIPPRYGSFRRVITVHDLTFLYYPQFLTAESARYYGQIDRAVRQADHILADSHATRRDLMERLGVPPEKVTVVHLAADPRCRPLAPARVRAVADRYGLPEPFLLFVGTLEPRKNVPTLLEAIHRLRRAGLEVPLVLVGRRGWLYDEVFARLQALGLEGQVRFLEGVTDEELVGLYNAARCLVLPSFYEGFGLPALEAMACGTPVIVSDRASLPEVVGEAGLLVDPTSPEALAEAIGRVWEDEALRQRMRRQGLAQAARFSWERVVRETLAVYEAVGQ